MCSITLYDETIPGLTFDEEGVSSLARDGLWRLDNEVYRGGDGRCRLNAWAERIKADGKGRDYDCVIGVSGGVDSSIVAVRVKELGLRPLALHLDNGWNIDLAVSNIERLIKTLNIDLITHVVDWREIQDLQRAYIKASVMDLECVSDHAINTLLYRTAHKMGIKYVIHGGNVATESTMPTSWGYDKRDGKNLLAIHKAYGEIPLRTYPFMKPYQLFWYLFVGRIKSFPILNYVDYDKKAAIAELQERFGYRPYARKHGENRFTRFYQEIYLPQKFGIDKRVNHLSSLILAGEITRDEALLEIREPLYEPDEELQELEFIGKKLGFTMDELRAYIAAPPRQHTDFANASGLFDHNRPIVQIARRVAKGEFSFSDIRLLRERSAH
ncbi:MAG: N-acetyl sugar amidotransferase [Rhizobiaceae bacterium]|nr:N-acetyl sugar amidotransferase [Rhizobiaceae bacterium]